MKDKSLIIGSNNNGDDITILTVELWLSDIHKHKNDLADLIYNRLYNRYIKPFNYDNPSFKSDYKNGFAIMASSCLLIETYISFTVPEFINTYRKSERCFGYFFTTEKRFKAFAIGGLNPKDYINREELKGKGIPKKFYRDVRCGILHNGETRKNWRIRRDSNRLLLISRKSNLINATLFLSELSEVLKDYKQKLIDNNESSEIWLVCKERLEFLIKKS
ncbi:hypothetical protein LNJ05_12640 [Tenacibaculum finnmarkense genomovar ulcerans]|uniref:hypothetical protein n=1 Tax=Tenacibaculum finnmarkense TaxID=2781243 RepID=UPI001E4F681D|nr:hypothetical protein [Tenacibaculum finnmarkense]MCD8433611.1 hypothetical protein [Tenacibaculum finnmarkense genomovar ulcerans]